MMTAFYLIHGEKEKRAALSGLFKAAVPRRYRRERDATKPTASAGCAILSLLGARIESLPLDGPQQELIQLLVLG
jgi:hypothetical protein